MTCADLLFTGGLIRCGFTAGDARTTDALAVAGGRIVALGAAARQLSAAAHIDLGGGVLQPGFGDGHVHPLWGGVELCEAPIRDCRSVGEIAAAVRGYAAANPDTEWITGGSYDPSLAPNGVFDASWLDAVLADRPVVLTAADHHVAWCNSEALRRAGITAATQDPPSSVIVRRGDGTPVGTLREWNAMALVTRLVPPPTTAEKCTALRSSTGLLAAAGVTWAQEAALAAEDVSTYLAAADRGDLAVRVNIALRAEPGSWHAQRLDFAAARALAVDHPSVTVRTVKFFADGVVEAGTAAMLAPYADDPASCGHPVWDSRELAAAVTAFDGDGFSIHIHAIGDAGVRAALDAIEAATVANGRRDRRAVLAHVQVVDPADLPRFAELGVIANFEPLWAQLDGCQVDLTIPRLGPVRARRQYPMAALGRAGVRLSMGSDWPVSSLRPLEGLAVAVTRQTPGGVPEGGWLPEQRLSARAAVTAYTSGVAYQAFEEGNWGSLEVGTRADLVHLGGDLCTVPPRDWPQLPVRGTWLAGAQTFGAYG